MFYKNQEQEPLKLQDYFIQQKSWTRFMLWALVILHILIFFLWISNYDETKTKHDEILVNPKRLELQGKDLIFIKAEIYENYNENNSMWKNNKDCVMVSDNEKFDCHPEDRGNEETCNKRGCCWEPKNFRSQLLNVPWCYYPQNYGGYKLVNRTVSKMGIRAFLSRSFPSPYPNDVKLIRMDTVYQNNNVIHIKIVDASSNRYEPPIPDIPVVGEKFSGEPAHKFVLSPNGFKIIRDNKNVLFDTENLGGFIFADQFLQMSGKFSGKIYGLGEHETSLELNTSWTKFTMFNRDGIPVPRANLYGSHPFFLVVEPDGKSSGMFLHNSNAMDVLLQPLPAITFRTIGGIFDFYFFTGPTPGDVIKQYTEIIGRSFMPPYWSLGFHLSRFGYKDTKDIRSVWERTRAAKIPFDSQWHDLDYMDKRNDFTYDKRRYGDLPKFVEEVHRAGMHYVPILDPGISGCEPNGTYPPYDQGIASDVFVKNQDGSVFVGKVWNSKCTVFPDFTAANTMRYWADQIKKFHDLIPFDGLWIDMNEPSNFLDGSVKGCPSNKWEDPPYLPDVVGGKLRYKTICMSARQAAGLHYDVHNLYGISEAIATYRGLRQLGKRPFVISRSTYPGIGRYAGHWSGDVVSTWHAMKKSIPKMLSFSLFGIPMMGADICGFNGNSTAMLCQRWSQLGAFYPFSRNHNSDDAIDQDPVAFGEEVINSTRKALTVRYTLLPYLYTLFYKAHTEGETVARPLFFEFGDDPITHSLDESFLWGCCVLIVPVLKEYATTVTTYLPAGRWYDWYTGLGTQSNGTYVVLHAPSDTIPVFIRGGVVLPTQNPDVTTTLSRLNNIELIVASNKFLQASGTFYWDDGESLGTFQTGEYGVVDFVLTPSNLSSHVNHWGYQKVPLLDSIKILGFVKPIKNIYLNKKEVEFKWNPTSLVLSVKITHLINLPFVLQWKANGV